MKKLKIEEIVSKEGWDLKRLVVEIGLKLNEVIEENNKRGIYVTTGTNHTISMISPTSSS